MKRFYDGMANVLLTIGVALLVVSVLLVPSSQVLGDDETEGYVLAGAPTPDCVGCPRCVGVPTPCPPGVTECRPVTQTCAEDCDCVENPNGGGLCWCRNG